MSKVSRRKFLQGLGLAAAGAAAAACQPQTVVVEKEVTKVVEKEVEKVVKETVIVEKMQEVEINMWGWVSPIWESVVADFEAEHPHITVNLSELGESVFGDQKYLTAVAAGKGPDVAIQNKHTFAQFAAKGLYKDVTPYFEQEGLKREDFFSMQLNEVTWDGKIYGLPRWGAVRYLHWNRKHFEEAGLDPDTPPTTWAELEEYAAKLNKRDANGNYERYGFIPYLVGNSWMWLYGGLNGAPALSEDKRTVLCDDQRWIDALQWMVDFYDNYVGDFELANSFSQSLSDAGLGGPFEAGKMSMEADGDWAVATNIRDPELDWAVAPMPIPPGGQKYSWSCGFCLTMPPSATYPEAAWELMRWWTGIGGWQALAKAEVADTERLWEREQIEGTPIYWPQDPDYIPAYEMVTEEYISNYPDHLQNAWGIGQDLLMNHSSGCGVDLMGLSALDYWVEMDNAVRAALSHKMTAEEAMLDCKKKVQEATDRAWETIDEL